MGRVRVRARFRVRVRVRVGWERLAYLSAPESEEFLSFCTGLDLVPTLVSHETACAFFVEAPSRPWKPKALPTPVSYTHLTLPTTPYV